MCAIIHLPPHILPLTSSSRLNVNALEYVPTNAKQPIGLSLCHNTRRPVLGRHGMNSSVNFSNVSKERQTVRDFHPNCAEWNFHRGM